MKTFSLLTLCLLLIAAGCSKNDAAPRQPSSVGTGGSMARFAVVADHLYTVSEHSISSFDISNANLPVEQTTTSLGFGVETIFPYGNTLFIGTQTGMKILDVSNPDQAPTALSDYIHIRSCDPVVANSTHAYVTLRTGNTCTRGLNELHVLDVTNLRIPKVVKTYQMSNPKGLALDGTHLFVCDDGIKHYDVSSPNAIVLKKKVEAQAEDLIANDGILMAIGPKGLTQYSYQSGQLVLLSHIPTL